MVKDLFHLRPGDHLLDEAVQVPQPGLLLVVVLPAAPAVPLDEEGHGRQEEDDDEGQPDIEHQQHGNGAHDHDAALNNHGEGVVERVVEGVHVVGEAAHQLAMSVGVEVFEGQGLHMGEEVGADLSHHLLGGVRHELVIAPGGQHPRQVHAAHAQQHHQQPAHVAGQDVIVDGGLQEVGAHDVGPAADKDQHRHDAQGQLVPPQVAHELPEGLFRILGPLVGHCFRHKSAS